MEKCLFLAKLADQTERYDDMAAEMSKFVKEKCSLSEEERHLFSVAYKNMIGMRRNSWRIISGLELKKSSEAEAAKDYKANIEKELKEICDTVLDLLENDLLGKLADEGEVEARVFYLKMIGDYYRYKAEVEPQGDVEREKIVQKAQDAYEKATTAASGLSKMHPLRLGVGLNYSVYFYEIRNQKDKACEIAREAATAARSVQEQEDERDSALILKLLEDNLSLWTADDKDDEEDDQEDDD